METLVSDEYKLGDYHDAREHGILWALLNELLHLIVFVYTLYGMIQFKVKFIRRLRLVRWVALFIIAHSWYLCIKFAIIATFLYLFNESLESRSIELTQYNCSLLNHAEVFRRAASSGPSWQNSSHDQTLGLGHGSNAAALAANQTAGWSILSVPSFFASLNYPQIYADFLHLYGGPFKLLGNRSALMYASYFFTLYIMIAIFPIELMYLSVGFNYIRFVLSDPSCMRELYQNRKRHLDRLASWSRNETDSELSLGARMSLNQRDLRSRYADDCHWLPFRLVAANMSAEGQLLRPRPKPILSSGIGSKSSSPSSSSVPSSTGRLAGTESKGFNWHETSRGRGPRLSRRNQFQLDSIKSNSSTGSRRSCLQTELSRVATAEYKLTAKLKPLRPRLAINYREIPSYEVRVANRNLETFKPFVRSKDWFKFSMIIYPIFIFYYFIQLTIVVGTISVLSELNLRSLSATCARESDSNIDLLSQWTFLDRLLYVETQYAIFAIGCSSSFYCSYYFGTILELHVWKEEIAQQLDLCKVAIEISQDFVENHREEKLYLYKLLDAERNWAPIVNVNRCFSEFGGLKCFKAHLQMNHLMSQRERFQMRELMALKLLSKKQTLLRVTYINMCLFLDELNDTRFMTNTILRRTTQLAFLFALVASMTRSQFKANYWHLTCFLGIVFSILNLYLVCAAITNSSINKLLVQVHSLISASLWTGWEDADLFEFWVRHIRSLGEDRDVMSYKIYGYKITWASILNFDSAVCTAYFYTIY